MSIAFVLLSFNLIIQKNKEQIVNLGAIGYSYKAIAKFYQVVFSIATVIAILPAIVLSVHIRTLYLEKIKELFEFSKGGNVVLSVGFILMIILCLIYNVIIVKKIKSTINPTKQ